MGGAVTGAAIGASTCGDAFECWSPLIGASLGFASGVAAGGFVGTGVSAHLTHERAGRALLGSTLGLGAGVGVMALGVASSSGEVMLLGVGVAVVGVPVGGAIAVATDRHVAVLPDVRRDGGGLRITGTF
ncbi:MAG: hypothetical protein H6735_33655 [Alphaproteobacteria bacterium]|nr:hypothetical protein [Alphaproteobacteria bacterium]